MEARKSGERVHFDDRSSIPIDPEDSSNSFDAFTCYKALSQMTLPKDETATVSDDAIDKKPLHGPDYDTPKSKKSIDFMHQPVRRRLIFSSQDEKNENVLKEREVRIDEKNAAADHELKLEIERQEEVSKIQLPQSDLSCADNSLQSQNLTVAPEEKSVPKISTKLPISQKESVKTIGTRRIAQLVVWTKNPCKESLTVEKESVPPPTASVPIPVSSENPSSEGNLFFVQYPNRGPSDGKRKGPKRLKKSPSKKSRRKASHKKKSTVQKSTAGRAYRTYLHTCLEKQQRQQEQIKSDFDFKVEKLFQPERGVALPGEIFLASSAPSSSCAPPVDDLAPVSLGLENNQNDNDFSLLTASATPPPCHHDAPTSLVGSKDSYISDKSGGESEIEKAVQEAERAGGSSEVTIFELPESFTVSTTDTANEFDLLIQNVVHEEMVDVDDEEDLMGDKFENCNNKRMRMSTGTSSVSSEDSMSMYESGKPRCTYTELIEKALTESGGLTVSEIYTWISDRYPFFKPDDDRWKNSVRHNLSINPYFKKGEKARSGAGHLWTISEKSKGLRPSMVSWDERRKSPCDPLEIDMPMESETDRAVANILGQYLSECRANREASGKDKNESDTSSSEAGTENLSPVDTPSQSTPNSQPEPNAHQQETQVIDSGGVTCDTIQSSDLGSFSLNELNSGQFTVDLAGISIPEGGSINSEELMNAGRLIYIQTDPDANKENDSTQAVILNECMLPELSSLTNNAGPHEDPRFHSFYSDALSSVDLEFGKGDSIPGVSFANDVSHNMSYTATTFTTTGSVGGNCQDVLGSCGQLVPQSEVGPTEQHHHHQDLTVLDQVIPMPYDDEVMTVSGTNIAAGMSENLPPLSAAALYESKELGISYTYQTEPSNHNDIL